MASLTSAPLQTPQTAGRPGVGAAPMAASPSGTKDEAREVSGAPAGHPPAGSPLARLVPDPAPSQGKPPARAARSPPLGSATPALSAGLKPERLAISNVFSLCLGRE